MRLSAKRIQIGHFESSREMTSPGYGDRLQQQTSHFKMADLNSPRRESQPGEAVWLKPRICHHGLRRNCPSLWPHLRVSMACYLWLLIKESAMRFLRSVSWSVRPGQWGRVDVARSAAHLRLQRGLRLRLQPHGGQLDRLRVPPRLRHFHPAGQLPHGPPWAQEGHDVDDCAFCLGMAPFIAARSPGIGGGFSRDYANRRSILDRWVLYGQRPRSRF